MPSPPRGRHARISTDTRRDSSVSSLSDRSSGTDHRTVASRITTPSIYTPKHFGERFTRSRQSNHSSKEHNTAIPTVPELPPTPMIDHAFVAQGAPATIYPPANSSKPLSTQPLTMSSSMDNSAPSQIGQHTTIPTKSTQERSDQPWDYSATIHPTSTASDEQWEPLQQSAEPLFSSFDEPPFSSRTITACKVGHVVFSAAKPGLDISTKIACSSAGDMSFGFVAGFTNCG